MTPRMTPQSPQATASLFVHAILAGDISTAWAVTDAPLRVALTTAIIEGNAAPVAQAGLSTTQAADELEALGVLSPLWPSFAACLIASLRRQLADVNLETWGWTMDPHPVSIDHETVLLVDLGRCIALTDGSVGCPAKELLMRCGEAGWWVTGLNLAGHPSAELRAVSIVQ